MKLIKWWANTQGWNCCLYEKIQIIFGLIYSLLVFCFFIFVLKSVNQ